MSRNLLAHLPVAIGVLLAAPRAVSADPPFLESLRAAIGEYEARDLDSDDLVVRSNLPLARLKLRKAELLLTSDKYSGATDEAARWEVEQGMAALARIGRAEVAYAGDTAGFQWPAANAALAGGGQAPADYAPRYYEYAVDADNDGSPQPFLVEVPPDYDPGRAWPLIVHLHGYHGAVDMIRKWDTRAIADLAKEQGYLVVSPHGRSETDFVGVGEADVLQALREVKRYYNVDPDRTYLAGGSMGGYGALNLALKYPHLWAAVIANVASCDMLAFGGLPRAELPAFRRFHFVRNNPIDLAGNAPNLPIIARHGGADTWVPPENTLRFAERRHQLGGLYEFEIVPDAHHEVCEQYAPGLEWLEGRERDLWPRTVVHKTFSLRHGQSYWVRITDIDTWGRAAEIRALAEGNTVTVTTSNVTAYELDVAAPLVDRAQPVRVVSDGEVAFEGAPPHGPMVVGEAPSAAAHKAPGLCGPFEDVFNHPFLVVRGTIAATQERRRRLDDDAEWFRNRWEAYTDGWPRVKNDVGVTEADIEAYGLLLLGRSSENAVTARAADALPVEFIDDGFRIDGRTYEGDGLGLALIYPNPLNPARYVAVFAGARYGPELPENHPFAQLPDVLLFRGEPVSTPLAGASNVFGRPNEHLFAAFFGSSWELDPDSTWTG